MSDGKARISVWIDIKNKLKSGMNAGREQIKQYVDQAKSKIREVSAGHREMIDNITGSVPGASEVLGALSNPYTAIAAAIGAVIAVSIKLATHLFEQSAAIQKHQQTVQATFGATGREMEIVTAKGMAASDMFERDFDELSTAANNFFQEYKENGLNSAGAMTLLQKGLIATNNLLDVDNVKEYSAHLKAAGLSAEEAMGFISAQTSKGVFSDKMVDSIKEFQLRIREMPKSTQDALNGIGLSAQKMAQDINSGKLSTMDAIREVTRAMKGNDVVARQTAIADIFGGPGEDLGERLLLTIGDMNTNLDEQIAKMGTVAQTRLQTLGIEEQIYMKQQQYAPLLNDISSRFEIMKAQGQLFFYDMVAKGIDWIMQYKDDFISIWEAIKPILIGVWELWKVQWKISAAVFGSVIKFISYGINLIKLDWEFFTRMIGDGMELGKLYVKSFVEYTMALFKNVAKAWDDLKKGNFSDSWNSLTADIKTKSSVEIENIDKKGNAWLNDWSYRRAQNDAKLGQGIVNSFKSVFAPKSDKPKDKATATGTETYGGKAQNLYEGKVNLGAGDKDKKKGAGAASDGMGKVTGKAEQVRNITFNMDAMMKMGDFVTQNPSFAKMSPQELEKWFGEMLKRAIANVETSYAS